MDTKDKNEFNIHGNVGGIFPGDNAHVDNINVGTSNQNQDELAKVLVNLLQKIDTLQGTKKEEAQLAAKALETEARKGDGADEKTVQKWFNFLLETAPDAWDVAVDTFMNPIKGVHTVFQKVAKRAKENQSKSS